MCGQVRQPARRCRLHHYLQTTLDGRETIDGQIWRLATDKRAEVARIVDGLPTDPDQMTAVERDRAQTAAKVASQSVAGDVVAELTRQATSRHKPAQQAAS